MSRDEAANDAGVSRSTAAFHLDRLVEDGLLETEFRRLGDRRGPGAGRPAKLYRRARRDIEVSLPSRRYQLAADLLAGAVSRATAAGSSVADAVRDVAGERGAQLAASVAPAAGSAGAAAGAGPDMRAAFDVLAEEGYEPRLCEGEIALANCPFHALVGDHTELVCGMNLALLDGFARALPGAALTARLEPSDDYCCVRFTRSGPAGQEVSQ